MKFSTRATYGLSAMLHLAERYGERAVPVSQIAKEEGISASYLEQLLNRLNKKSWIKSIRGPQGGYLLTTKPCDISVGALLEALGENIRISTKSPKALKTKDLSTTVKASRLFWAELQTSVLKTLEAISLQDLITRARTAPDVQKGSLPINFNI